MSVLLNIAEGAGRFTKPDKRRFYWIARGSLFECVAILDFLQDEGTIGDYEYSKFYKSAEEISKMLFAMIGLLKRS